LKPDVTTVSTCVATIGTNLLHRSVYPTPYTEAGLYSNSHSSACADEQANQTGSGLYHSIVKEQVLPGQLEGRQTIANSTDATLSCQQIFNTTNKNLEFRWLLFLRRFIRRLRDHPSTIQRSL